MRQILKTAILATLAWAAISHEIHAQNLPRKEIWPLSGNELLNACKDKNLSPFCLGYTMAAVDAISLAQAAGKMSMAPVCTPSNATSGQVRDVVEKYIYQNPESRHMSAVVLVVLAIRDSWPCS